VAYRFITELWVHEGENPWYFVTLPPDQSDEIEALSAPSRRGFGSVRVHVTIGASTWSTSLFPDSRAGAYVLPIKQKVRLGERLQVGESVAVSLRLAGE